MYGQGQEETFGETGVRIERVWSLIEIKDFVVLATACDAEEPFYTAQG